MDRFSESNSHGMSLSRYKFHHLSQDTSFRTGRKARFCVRLFSYTPLGCNRTAASAPPPEGISRLRREPFYGKSLCREGKGFLSWRNGRNLNIKNAEHTLRSKIPPHFRNTQAPVFVCKKPSFRRTFSTGSERHASACLSFWVPAARGRLPLSFPARLSLS